MGAGGWVFNGLGLGIGDAAGWTWFKRRFVMAEALQVIEGAVEGAFGGIDAALEEVELMVRAGHDLAERGVLIGSAEGFGGVGELVGPKLGFGAAETAELPIGADEVVDKGAFGGGGGLPLEVIVAGEGLELTGVLARDDLRLGLEAGFEGVEARDGFSFGRARARGVLRVATVGFDLELRRHCFPGMRIPGRGRGTRGRHE